MIEWVQISALVASVLIAILGVVFIFRRSVPLGGMLFFKEENPFLYYLAIMFYFVIAGTLLLISHVAGRIASIPVD